MDYQSRALECLLKYRSEASDNVNVSLSSILLHMKEHGSTLSSDNGAWMHCRATLSRNPRRRPTNRNAPGQRLGQLIVRRKDGDEASWADRFGRVTCNLLHIELTQAVLPLTGISGVLGHVQQLLSVTCGAEY